MGSMIDTYDSIQEFKSVLAGKNKPKGEEELRFYYHEVAGSE